MCRGLVVAAGSQEAAVFNSMNPTLGVVILAAGDGTRMRSALPKVLHPACGVPLLEHVLRLVTAVGANERVVVVSPTILDLVTTPGGRRADHQGVAHFRRDWSRRGRNLLRVVRGDSR